MVDGLIIFAFDRDQTVDVNEGPVPLRWIKILAKYYPVWAVGNQMLVVEAGIPGREELKRRIKFPVMPKEYRGLDKKIRNTRGKEVRLIILNQLYPFAKLKVVVDNHEIALDGWSYFKPQEFVENFRPLIKPLINY